MYPRCAPRLRPWPCLLFALLIFLCTRILITITLFYFDVLGIIRMGSSHECVLFHFFPPTLVPGTWQASLDKPLGGRWSVFSSGFTDGSSLVQRSALALCLEKVNTVNFFLLGH